METSTIINPATHEFVVPTKTLVTVEDLEKFKASGAFKEIVSFIIALQKSIERKTNLDVQPTEV